MVEPLRLGKKELRERHGASERLAVRVGALLARGVGVTAAVVELASPGSHAEALLLAPSLLEKAAKLTKRDLAAVRKATRGAGDLPPLAVRAEEGLRVLCLEEEIEAEKGFQAPGGGQLALPQATSLLGPEEAQRLFTPEEIARLKFVLLTSADPKAKIEAIRSALVSPLPPEEKGVLCLMALGDDTPEVRRETAKALRHLGLDADLTDSIRGLADGDPKARRAALSALRRFGPRASRAERGVVLRLLFSVLETEKDDETAALGVDVLADMSELLASAPEALPDLVRIVLRLLSARFDAIAPAARRLCRELGGRAAASISKVLWSQVESAPERRVKAWLLLLVSDLPLADAEKARLAAELARTVADWSDADADCRRLTAAFEGLGKHAVQALIDAWPEVKEDQQPFVLRLLDVQLGRTEAPKDLGPRLARLLESVLATARRSLRLALMETRLMYHPSLGVEAKRRIAQELLRSAHDHRLDRVYDLTETVLHRMGIGSAEPLRRAVEESPYDEVRLLALKVLSRQVAAASDHADAKEVERTCQWAERLLAEMGTRGQESRAGGQESRAGGQESRALGAMAQGALAPADFVQRVAAALTGRLGKGETTLDDVQALAAVAGSPVASMKTRLDIAMLFLELLGQEVPSDLAEERRTAEGTLLEIKKPAVLYTDFLPAVVEGLERIALAADVTESLLDTIVKRLVARWAEVSEYKVIWGPNAVMRLGEALGAIGAGPKTPLYLRLAAIDALRTKVANVTIAQVLAKVLSAPEEAEPFLRACDEMVEELCRMAVHADYREREDRLALLESLGRLALRAALAPAAKRTDALRRRIVELLFDGVRERMAGAREALAAIAEDEAVPKAFRAQVRQRLQRV